MSSSIPLAYLGVRKESEAPSIGRTSRRISSDHAIGVSRQSPTISSNGEPLGEIEPNERVDEIVPSIEFEEGGYGWVVTGCKPPAKGEKKTEYQAHSPSCFSTLEHCILGESFKPTWRDDR